LLEKAREIGREIEHRIEEVVWRTDPPDLSPVLLPAPFRRDRAVDSAGSPSVSRRTVSTPSEGTLP
jgi:hypothetical protein